MLRLTSTQQACAVRAIDDLEELGVSDSLVCRLREEIGVGHPGGPSAIPRKNMNRIAQEQGVHRSTITRIVQKLGIKRLNEVGLDGGTEVSTAFDTAQEKLIVSELTGRKRKPGPPYGREDRAPEKRAKRRAAP